MLEFAFDGDKNNLYLPHTHDQNTVCYTGTHDNNTLLGFVWGCDDVTRRDMLDYCGFTDWNWDRPETYDAIIRTLMHSVADLAIMPIQDVLGLDSTCRMNAPGTVGVNWRWRLIPGQVTAEAGKDLLGMSKRFARANWDALNAKEAKAKKAKEAEKAVKAEK